MNIQKVEQEGYKDWTVKLKNIFKKEEEKKRVHCTQCGYYGVNHKVVQKITNQIQCSICVTHCDLNKLHELV